MNRILRHIKDGVMGIVRHFALSFSSISSVTMTLILMSVFMILSQNMNQITKQIEQNVSLYVQIDAETVTKDIRLLTSKVNAIEGILNVKFSSKDDELEIFIESREEGEALFGYLRGEDNPFLDALIINLKSGTDIKDVAKKVESLDNVYKVSFGGDATQRLLEMLEKVRTVGLVFVLVLGFIAIFLIANTIGATIHSRQKEISIMRSIGATNWYIRWPFVIEGMIIGILGSIVPILLTTIGYSKFYETQSKSFDSMFKLVQPIPLIWIVSGVLIGLGVLVGSFGSLIASSRRLRWTR